MGIYGYIEYSNKVKLKSGFVLPEYRRKGIYTELQLYILDIVRAFDKPIFSNTGLMNYKAHLKQGAKIVKTYKSNGFLIKYE